MSDQPRRKPRPADDDGYEVIAGPDADYEVVEPPPARPAPPPKLAIAKRAVRKPPPPDDYDEDDDFDDRPAARPHWFFRYVVNLRGAIAFAVLVFVLTAAGAAMWLMDKTQQMAARGGVPVGPSANPVAGQPAAARTGLQAEDIGPAPAGPPPLPAGWQEYTDHLGTFVARVPDGAAAATVPVKEWGAATVKPRGLRWEKGPVSYYLLVVEEWPPRRGNSPPADDWQQDVSNRSHLGWFDSYARLPGTFFGTEQPRAAWLAGKRGAAVSRQSTDGKQALHLRGMAADGFGYYLAVTGPKELSDKSPEVAAFFDGFKLTPGATPPPGATAPPAAQPDTPPAAKGAPPRRKKA